MVTIEEPKPKAEGVALVCADCRYPRLAHRALVKSLEQCDFEAAYLLTDDIGAIADLDPRIESVAVPPIASGEDYSRFMLKELVRYVPADFIQVVQWDGYVIRGSAWDEEFKHWDYIGARWWFRPEGSNVGNGGFSLRSRRLLEALQDEDIPVDGNEDGVIGVSARGLLESRHGIRIAPTAIADRYAFEGAPPSGREFGFHRISNLPVSLGRSSVMRSFCTCACGSARSQASTTVGSTAGYCVAGAAADGAAHYFHYLRRSERGRGNGVRIRDHLALWQVMKQQICFFLDHAVALATQSFKFRPVKHLDQSACI